MLVDFLLETEINKLKTKLSIQELELKKLVPDLFSLREELLESKQDYTNFYDFNTSIYLTIDSNYIIHTLNFQAALLLGINRQQGINKSLLSFIACTSQSNFKDTIKTLVEKQRKQIGTIEVLHKGGTKKQIILESTLSKNNLIRLCLLDVTENTLSNDRIFELENSLNLINSLFQLTHEPSAGLNNELNIIVANETFNNFFSSFFSTKIAIGINLISALSHIPDIQLKIKLACEQAIEGKISSVMIESDCNNISNLNYYCYELCCSSLVNQHYQKNDLIIQIKNHTDFKLQEMRLHKQQADIALSWRTRAMGEMASALTHEISQPLAAISAYSQGCLFILEKMVGENKIASQLALPLRQMASQVELTGEILQGMKKFMKEGALHNEPTDINLLIKDTLSVLHYELLDFHTPIKITLDLTEPLPKIRANKISIMQVILNLARNSIEALQNDVQNVPELSFKTHCTSEDIIIHVDDNGPGIPEQYKNKILNTYFTTKAQGTGIGLGICKTLIEEHGGTINFSQNNKKGTSFVITLPIIH